MYLPTQKLFGFRSFFTVWSAFIYLQNIFSCLSLLVEEANKGCLVIRDCYHALVFAFVWQVYGVGHRRNRQRLPEEHIVCPVLNRDLRVWNERARFQVNEMLVVLHRRGEVAIILTCFFTCWVCQLHFFYLCRAAHCNKQARDCCE